MSPRPVPAAVIATQARASDPALSAFVAANAGSGKTHVLANRVIRLLLDGTPPARILCITYTRAAAANMKERVFSTLGRWIALDDDALDTALRALGIAAPDAARRTTARQLFAEALETPGGLRIETIHALATRLLQQFPFEAGVTADFTVLEERDAAAMLARATMTVLTEAAAAPATALGGALADALRQAGDDRLQAALAAAVAWRQTHGDAGEDTLAGLSQALGLGPQDTADTIAQTILSGPHLPPPQWPELIEALRSSSANDQKAADRLAKAQELLTRDAAMPACVAAYLDLFCTTGDDEAGGKMVKMRKRLVTQNFVETHPTLAERVSAEGTRIEPLAERWRAVLLRDRSATLMRLADAIAIRYRADKEARGALDFDDLITTARAMLARTDAGWVQYKLDQGIDHILIDEAQDTSPGQWEIVARLAAEFFAGHGARHARRTLFAVGDEKQSIFSFQGAVPGEFAERQRFFKGAFERARSAFDLIPLRFSFRSGPAILKAVDGVFAAPDMSRSITASESSAPMHEALADAAPALVDLWLPEAPDDRTAVEAWRAPLDAVPETDARVKLARRIAREIRRLTDGRHATGRADERRALRPGDVLVLVRRRGSLFSAIIQALKQSGIAVAGADRLTLSSHAAVNDLMALADAVLMPRDDLALAIALKSPLFGLDEDDPGERDLFDLAYRRDGTLRDALIAKAQHAPHLAAMLDRLRRHERGAATLRPFDFFADVLGADGGRTRFLRRLGHEANDALDEFLELALSYERSEPATLQGFMAWLRAADSEIKRDMELTRDEVRVMTVHGAKGLEAPVVFLPDTMAKSSAHRPSSLLALGDGFIWPGKREEECRAERAARLRHDEDERDEHRRLLYVAMTRAAERLIVGGALGRDQIKTDGVTIAQGCWYELIQTGLAASGLTRMVIETPDGPVTRFSDPGQPLRVAATPAEQPAGPSTALPEWLGRQTIRPTTARVLRPSADPETGQDEGANFRLIGLTDDARMRARQRGVLAHRLLQSLPDLAADRQTEAALRFLARHAPDWPDDARTELAQQVVALLHDPRFAAVFAAGSRAEVAMSGSLMRADGGRFAVSAQIDRLVVQDETVLIVDYKTAPVPPSSDAGVPDAYARQLALYRALIAKAYPGRTVAAALVWTALPRLDVIDPARLDAALAALLAPESP